MTGQQVGELLKNVAVLVAAGLMALGIYLIAQPVTDTESTKVQNTIKLASAVIGFGVSVYGGVKALVALTKPAFNIQEVQAASLTGISGAVLLLASQI